MNINEFIESCNAHKTIEAFKLIQAHHPGEFWSIARLVINAAGTSSWHNTLSIINTYEVNMLQEAKARYPMHIWVATIAILTFDLAEIQTRGNAIPSKECD